MTVTSDSPSGDNASTRDRILEVAERLFAEQGYNGVSLRGITTAANANMASVHYYFGTKEALLRAIFEARVGPLSQERRRLLDEVLQAAGDQAPPVRGVLAAFIGPGMRLGRTPAGATFNRLSAICSVDPDPAVKNIVFGVHDDVARPFAQALRRACPHIDAGEFFLRLQCVFGSMMYIRADNGRVDRLLAGSGEQAVRADPDTSLEQLLDFLEAGLTAPAHRRPG